MVSSAKYHILTQTVVGVLRRLVVQHTTGVFSKLIVLSPPKPLNPKPSTPKQADFAKAGEPDTLVILPEELWLESMRPCFGRKAVGRSTWPFVVGIHCTSNARPVRGRSAILPTTRTSEVSSPVFASRNASKGRAASVLYSWNAISGERVLVESLRMQKYAELKWNGFLQTFLCKWAKTYCSSASMWMTLAFRGPSACIKSFGAI